jgi:hypothetical protein
MDDASVLGSVCGQLKEEAKGHGCCKNLGPDSEVNVGWGFKATTSGPMWKEFIGPTEGWSHAGAEEGVPGLHRRRRLQGICAAWQLQLPTTVSWRRCRSMR